MSNDNLLGGEPDFDAFLADASAQEARREAMEMTANRFTLFLSDFGVIFDPQDFTALTGIGEHPLEDASLQAIAANNRRHVLTLVTMKLVHESIVARGGSTPADTKKRLQARELANGSTEPWLQLIDSEFLGEPLTDGDVGIVLEESRVLEETKRTVEARYVDAQVRIHDYLETLGITELSDEEHALLPGLTYLLVTASHDESPALAANTCETAQVFAVRLGVDMGVWGQVIKRFLKSILSQTSNYRLRSKLVTII